jgi:hypothetical protein
VHIRSITFDCADPYRLATFWAEVTGFREDPENKNEPGDPEGLLVAPDGRLNLLFIQVAESPAVKNGRRLDLVPTERTRDAEVDRLLAIGATVAADHRQPDGSGWAVLADPEGNEFSVQRSAAEGGEAFPVVEPAGATLPRATFMAAALQWLNRPVGPRSQSQAEGGSARRGPTPLARLGRSLSRELVARLRQLIRLVLLVVEGLIAVRIIFKLSGANESAGFATFLYKLTSPLVSPFHPVFADHLVNGHPFELGSLLAMGVYAALAYLGLRVVRVIFSPHS